MSFRGLLSLFTMQQKLYHHLQLVQSLFHITTDNIGVPRKLYVAHTHTPVLYVTELFTHEVLLYSSLYLFEYCCFHLNCGTVHPDIVHRNKKRELLSQSTFHKEFVEKSAR